MVQREIREEIFKILFENEIINSDVDLRIDEFLLSNKLSESKKEFFVSYIRGCLENKETIISKIKENLQGWTYERLGFTEKVLLQMSFYEIYIKDEGYEIVINEAVELAKKYGDSKTPEFINGILATALKGKENGETC